MGTAIIVIVSIMKIPEQGEKPPFRTAFRRLPHTLDPVGFLLFIAAIIMLLLALTWGGVKTAWSSPISIGLLCAAFSSTVVFCWWVWFKGEDALIPPSCLTRRCVSVGSVVIFLQGGASQALPFFLPLWFQAIKGDGPSMSAVHLLPSLITMVLALIAFGTFLRKLRYLPPWAIIGSAIASIGSGLYTMLSPGSTVGAWVGYQIFTSIGRGFAFQVVSCCTLLSMRPITKYIYIIANQLSARACPIKATSYVHVDPKPLLAAWHCCFCLRLSNDIR